VPVEKIVEKLVVKEVPVDRIVTVTKEVLTPFEFPLRLTTAASFPPNPRHRDFPRLLSRF
jgi:hypothetical protein